MHSYLPTSRTRGPSSSFRELKLQEASGNAGDAKEAVRGLSDYFGGDTLAFHGAFLNRLESASSRMRQQLVDEARRQRADFALDTHDKTGKTVLDLAVRHDDTEFASYLLRDGANPKRTSLSGASARMQTLVTQWRLRNLFYADQAKNALPSKPCHGALDLALNEGRFADADKLLQKEMEGNTQKWSAMIDSLWERLPKDIGGHPQSSHARLWDCAMEKGRHDVLRAMLILRREAMLELTKDKQEVGKWLDKLHQYPELSAALKEFPCQSAKRGAPQALNLQARFSNKMPIVCRHLAAYHQEEQALHPKIKFDYEKFNGLNAIADNVPSTIETTYDEKLIEQASAAHLIDNRKFGQFLAGQFHEMEGEDKPATRLMLVLSENHVMNLGLMIKEKKGRKSYVVKFYDPNDTTTHVRSKTDSVQAFETQTIEDYLATEGRLRFYYPEPKGLSMIFVRPKEGERTSASTITGFAASRRLTTCIGIEEVDATAIRHFMQYSFDANLMDLREHLYKVPQARRIELLTKQGRDGIPALIKPAHCGHTKAILIYGEVIQWLPSDQQVDLLLAKASASVFAGESAFETAVMNRQFNAAHALIELLARLAPRLSDGKRAALLMRLQHYQKCIPSSGATPEWSEILGALSQLKMRCLNAHRQIS